MHDNEINHELLSALIHVISWQNSSTVMYALDVADMDKHMSRYIKGVSFMTAYDQLDKDLAGDPLKDYKFLMAGKLVVKSVLLVRLAVQI